MTFPNVSEAFTDLAQPMTLETITRAVGDYESTETLTGTVVFMAVLEPIPEQSLLVKPEGQRNWMFWKMFTVQLLNINDVVVDRRSRKYRITRKADWGFNGAHYEYQITEAANTP